MSLEDSDEFWIEVASVAAHAQGCVSTQRRDSNPQALLRKVKGGGTPLSRVVQLRSSDERTIESELQFSVPSMRMELRGREVLEVQLEDLPRYLTSIDKKRPSDRWLGEARLSLGV